MLAEIYASIVCPAEVNAIPIISNFQYMLSDQWYPAFSILFFFSQGYIIVVLPGVF